MKGMICSLCGSPLEMDGRSRVKPCTGCIAELKIQSVTLKDVLIVKSELFTSEDLDEFANTFREAAERRNENIPIIITKYDIDFKSLSEEELESIGLRIIEQKTA